MSIASGIYILSSPVGAFDLKIADIQAATGQEKALNLTVGDVKNALASMTGYDVDCIEITDDKDYPLDTTTFLTDAAVTQSMGLKILQIAH